MRRSRAALIVFCCIAALILGAADGSFTDPAPPTITDLKPAPPAEPKANADATFHAAPKPIAAGAVTQGWPCFLGPNHNLVSNETKLLKQFPRDGLAIVWEMKKGMGYSAPAVLGDHLVLFH